MQCALPIWPIWPNFEVNGLDWQPSLAGSSKTAPRIFIFSIVLDAEYLSYVKFIETHAYAFLPLNISAAGSVSRDLNRDTMLVLTIFWDNSSLPI